MGKVWMNVRVDEALKKAVDECCESRGLVVSHFVQDALRDRLKELEDIDDIKRIRREPTRPLGVLTDENARTVGFRSQAFEEE